MIKNLTQRISGALVVAALCLPWVGVGTAMAQSQSLNWQINLPASSLTFNTTKSGAAGVGGITETMRFKSFSGGMDSKGRLQLNIDLASIDSGISIRDERMQTLFWNVVSQPRVTFSATLKKDDLQKINAGKESVTVAVEGLLSMAGQTKPVKTELQVTPVHNKLMVSTRQAIVINANDFGLNAGAEALRAIAGLSFVSTSAPVSFQLELTQ